jgi:putative tricarboxylic transport membrane protein
MPVWQPERGIELVAGTPAGGGQDRPARALIKRLAADHLVTQPIRLSNIPGRGGGNGWDYLRRQRGDPHVLAINSPTIITNLHLGVSDYDHGALTPLANLYTEYIAFVVRADSPIRDAGDFMRCIAGDGAGCRIALATALGNTNHMALARIARHAGGDIRAMPIRVFESALHAVDDVIAAQADVGAITAVSAAPAIADGRLRAIAVSSTQRLPAAFADTPTWKELGVDCVVGTWRGVIGAADISPAQAGYWRQALRAATATAEWTALLASQYWGDAWLEGGPLRDFLDRERAMLGAELHALGLAPAAAITAGKL